MEFRKTDHQRLRDTLAGSLGKLMVSYNDCPFVRDLYEGYYITAVSRINNLAQRYEGGCEFLEVIITNYNPKEREKASFQMNLFDYGFATADEDEPQYEISSTI